MQGALGGVCGARDGTQRLRTTCQHPHSDVSELGNAREASGSRRCPRERGREEAASGARLFVVSALSLVAQRQRASAYVLRLFTRAAARLRSSAKSIATRDSI